MINKFVAALVDFDQTKASGQTSQTFEGILYTIINTMIWAVGFIAVIMLIYGGIRYITAQGNEKNVGTARSIIMYAVIGLIITGIAGAIQVFVTTNITPPNPARSIKAELNLKNSLPKCTDEGLSTTIKFALRFNDGGDGVYTNKESDPVLVKCAATARLNTLVFKTTFEDVNAGKYKICVRNIDNRIDNTSCSTEFTKGDAAITKTWNVTEGASGVNVLKPR